MGDRQRAAAAAANLGYVRLVEGRYQQARANFEGVLAVTQELRFTGNLVNDHSTPGSPRTWTEITYSREPNSWMRSEKPVGGGTDRASLTRCLA